LRRTSEYDMSSRLARSAMFTPSAIVTSERSVFSVSPKRKRSLIQDTASASGFHAAS